MSCITSLAGHSRAGFVAVLGAALAISMITFGCSKTNQQGKKSESDASQQKQITLDTSGKYVIALALSPDGKLLAGVTGVFDGALIKIWNAQTGETVKTIKPEGGTVLKAVSFSPDGKLLAVAAGFIVGSGGELTWWDTQTWQPKHSIGQSGETTDDSVAFSQDGKLIASGDRDGSVSFWDVETAKQTKNMKALGGVVTFVVFLPDGILLASGGSGKVIFKPSARTPGSHTPQELGEVALLDLSTGKVKRTLATDNNDTTRYKVAFTPDGRTLATCGADNSVDLWDAQTGQVMKSFKGHQGVVKAIAISPDVKMLATAGDDKVIRLWNIETGEISSQLTGHQGPVTSVVFLPDSKTLASASEDKSVRLWQVK